MKEKHIYLLEDDPDIRELITYILTKKGYAVQEFDNVSDFNKQLQQAAPDLFILDISLPDGNGLTLWRELMATENYAGIPVIVMSADVFNQRKALDAGVQHFIGKPFPLDGFLDRVQTLLVA